MTEQSGLINEYTCNVCGETITTVNADEGTTPSMLSCRATEGCRGNMRSAYYMVDQGSMPEYEWYKPSKPPKGVNYEHVKMGGLLLRKL